MPVEVLQDCCGLLSDGARVLSAVRTERDIASWLLNRVPLLSRVNPAKYCGAWSLSPVNGCVVVSGNTFTFSSKCFVPLHEQVAETQDFLRISGLSARDAGCLKTSERVMRAVQQGKMVSYWTTLSCCVDNGKFKLFATVYGRQNLSTDKLMSFTQLGEIDVQTGWVDVECCIGPKFTNLAVIVQGTRMAIPADILVDQTLANFSEGFVPWVVSMISSPWQETSHRCARSDLRWCLHGTQFDQANTVDNQSIVLPLPIAKNLPIHAVLERACTQLHVAYDAENIVDAVWALSQYSKLKTSPTWDFECSADCATREEQGYKVLRNLFDATDWDPSRVQF